MNERGLRELDHGWGSPHLIASEEDTCSATRRDNGALDDLRREFGDRWDIAAIPQGYRAILRQTDGRAPVALYGRTPAELAESIRMAEGAL